MDTEYFKKVLDSLKTSSYIVGGILVIGGLIGITAASIWLTLFYSGSFSTTFRYRHRTTVVNEYEFFGCKKLSLIF
jgi:hypothetical protein